MRLWLGFAFALVGAITAVTVYRFVHDSNETVISQRSTELAVGRTVYLADQLGKAQNSAEVIRASKDTGFSAWYFNRAGRLVVPAVAGPLSLAEVLAGEGVAVLDGTAASRLAAAAFGPVVTLAIGPEGGWSPAERAAAGGRLFSLGPRNLRADTAALAGLAAVLAASGDL